MIYRFTGKISPFHIGLNEYINIKFITDFYMRKRVFCLTDRNLPYSLYVSLKNNAHIKIPISYYNGIYFLPVKNVNTLVSFRYPTKIACLREMVTLKNILEICKKEG